MVNRWRLAQSSSKCTESFCNEAECCDSAFCGCGFHICMEFCINIKHCQPAKSEQACTSYIPIPLAKNALHSPTSIIVFLLRSPLPIHSTPTSHPWIYLHSFQHCPYRMSMPRPYPPTTVPWKPTDTTSLMTIQPCPQLFRTDNSQHIYSLNFLNTSPHQSLHHCLTSSSFPLCLFSVSRLFFITSEHQ